MLKKCLTFGQCPDYNLSNTKIFIKGAEKMSTEELIALLLAELKDDLIGSVEKTESGLKLTFTDGTVRTIIVK